MESQTAQAARTAHLSRPAGDCRDTTHKRLPTTPSVTHENDRASWGEHEKRSRLSCQHYACIHDCYRGPPVCVMLTEQQHASGEGKLQVAAFCSLFSSVSRVSCSCHCVHRRGCLDDNSLHSKTDSS